MSSFPYCLRRHLNRRHFANHQMLRKTTSSRPFGLISRSHLRRARKRVPLPLPTTIGNRLPRLYLPTIKYSPHQKAAPSSLTVQQHFMNWLWFHLNPICLPNPAPSPFLSQKLDFMVLQRKHFWCIYRQGQGAISSSPVTWEKVSSIQRIRSRKVSSIAAQSHI